MHNRFPQRPKGRPPSLHNPALDPARQTLHDRKLAAWALTIGAHVPLATDEPGRRPHRGQLPDIDMTRLEPAPRSWRERLSGWFE
ncbi:hypothetical protein [Nitratireductor sp. ZSWI3]|uniref:hypothetical protein n=1 Tax=Nitratireductor sp. ZSWI3 TaxID=2966359 RepID=UPI0021504ECF|nr:hypothetical protein [Nitratireductor sp. ZSWI3]MCR4265743.1 hypothetical protein [Nitratireductor sp. ZSWI3]